MAESPQNGHENVRLKLFVNCFTKVTDCHLYATADIGYFGERASKQEAAERRSGRDPSLWLLIMTSILYVKVPGDASYCSMTAGKMKAKRLEKGTNK